MKVTHDKKWNRFNMHTDSGAQVGYIQYEPARRGEIRAVSTHVYPEYEGNGYAGMLLDALADYARNRGLKIVPVCSYVKCAFDKDAQKYAEVMGG